MNNKMMGVYTIWQAHAFKKKRSSSSPGGRRRKLQKKELSGLFSHLQTAGTDRRARAGGALRMDKWATGEDGDGGEYVPSDDDKPRPRSRLRKGGQSNAKRAAGSRNRAVKQSAAKPEAPEASALAQPPEPKLPIASADTSAAPPSLNAYLAKQRMIPKRDKQAKRRQLQQQQQTSSSGPSATTQNAVATAKAVAMSATDVTMRTSDAFDAVHHSQSTIWQ